MSAEKFTKACESCGLPLEDTHILEKNGFLICHQCTLNNTLEPDFEVNVYSIAIGYFINKKNIKDPSEALFKAHTFVSQLSYWKNKAHSFPSLEGLNNMLMTLAEATEEGVYGKKEEKPKFFISYYQTETNQPLVESLSIILEGYGYYVWLEDDKKEKKTSNNIEQTKKIIEKADFCVPILSKSYFSSVYQTVLKTILKTKDYQLVFPVWEKDIDVKFLNKQKYKELLEIMGIGWIDWQGDTKKLANQLVQRAQYTQGLQTYDSVPLVVTEVEALKALERLVGQPIPSLSKDTLLSAEFGFYTENNRIITLILAEKSITSLPDTLGQCLGLKTLDLTNNDLHELPSSFEQLRNLETLNIQGNQMQLLPPSFKTVHKHLMPQYPEVEQAEAEVLALLELLQGKPIPQVDVLESNTFGYITMRNHVTGLGLYNQGLKFLPEIFGNLTHLVELTLEKNRLQSLPETFGNLIKLERLLLKENYLQSLPETFGNLIKLEKLYLQENHLRSLPETFGNLKNLKELDLRHTSLRSLPETFGNLRNLNWLDLERNHLTSLPENFGQLHSLKHLNLHGNQLFSLSETFGNLKNLQTVRLEFNRLRSLPETFGNLKSLKELHLGNNQLRSLPKTIGNLRNLKSLYIDDNTRFLTIEKLQRRGCKVHIRRRPA